MHSANPVALFLIYILLMLAPFWMLKC